MSCSRFDNLAAIEMGRQREVSEPADSVGEIAQFVNLATNRL